MNLTDAQVAVGSGESRMPVIGRWIAPCFRWFTLIVIVGTSLYLALRSIRLAYDGSRPIPFWDQWEFFKSTSRILAGRYGFSDIIAQHNEHRIATSRIFFLLDMKFFDGTLYSCIVVLYAALAGIAYVLACSLSRKGLLSTTLFLLFFSFLVSPAQWENLSSGFQIQFPFVDLFCITSLACLLKAASRPVRDVPTLAFAAAATLFDLLAVFSMASGVLIIVPAVWIAILLRSRPKMIGAYIVLHLVYCVLFFVHYTRSQDIVSTLDPILISRYAIIYMGACLRGYRSGPFLLGAVDALCLAIAAASMLWHSRTGRIPADKVQVLVSSVALFLVANAVVTANGRASLGLVTAISSRYSLQSILLQICLFVFAWRSFDRRRIPPVPAGFVKVGLATGLLSLSALSSFSALSRQEWEERVAVLDTAGFALANGVVSDESLALVYPWPNLIKEAVEVMIMRRLGPFSTRYASAFRPPLNALAGWDPGLSHDCTAAMGAKPNGPHSFDLEGWAFDPVQPTSDGWMLVLDRSDNDRMVGFGRQSVLRPDVDDALKVAVGRSGFSVTLNVSPLPADEPHILDVVLIPESGSVPTCKASFTLAPSG